MEYKQKRAVIEGLLDHWQDFVLPSVGVTPAGGEEGTGILFASGMGSYPSVVELDRCLGLLARTTPNHYRHLRGHYSAEWRTTRAYEIDRRGIVKLHPVTRRPLIDPDPKKIRRERVVPGWVTWRIVDHALDMLVALWDHGVTLELPPALNRKLREFTDSDGTHLTEAA